jgi:hypothetical protein
MPLSISKSGKGYKVTDPEGHKYSKKAKSKKAAIAQMVAIEYAKKRRGK